MNKITKAFIVTGFIMISPILLYSSIINIPDDQSTLQAGISIAGSGDTVPITPGTFTNANN